MAWYAPDSFRVQAIVIGAACLSMAALGVALVQDAWRSTRQILLRGAEQQCVTAVRELKEQFADRASLIGAPDTLPFEAHDLSLRGLSAAVLRSYEDLEGGFLLGSQRRLAGHTGAYGRKGSEFREVEARLIRETAERARAAGDPIANSVADGGDLIVAATHAVASPDAVAWALKRLPGANDPAAQRRRWWLAALVLSAVLGLGSVVFISIRLRKSVDAVNAGLGRLEHDFSYRLPAIGGDMGRLGRAINQMADRRSILEATLRRQDRLAALGKVVAGVAHEIRNPLNSMRLTLEMLDRRTQRKSASGEEVRAAIEEVDRLDRILAQLLSFGRPDLDDRKVQNLQPLLDRAVRIVQDQSLRKDVEVKYTDDSGGLDADVDALSIEQVLINLLLNAIDASPAGRTVRVAAAAGHRELWIEVNDEGPGIPEGARDHVFDPFFTTKENGTGLGLTVSREIARQHGGSLEFESRGAGTTFVLKLPLTRSQA
ncbi:MAG: ATP-binding protein [Bryobacteraceae bacterium]